MNEIIYIIYYVTIVYIMYKYLNNICVSKKHKRPYIFSYLFKQIQNSSAILLGSLPHCLMANPHWWCESFPKPYKYKRTHISLHNLIEG